MVTGGVERAARCGGPFGSGGRDASLPAVPPRYRRVQVVVSAAAARPT